MLSTAVCPVTYRLVQAFYLHKATMFWCNGMQQSAGSPLICCRHILATMHACLSQHRCMQPGHHCGMCWQCISAKLTAFGLWFAVVVKPELAKWIMGNPKNNHLDKWLAMIV